MAAILAHPGKIGHCQFLPRRKLKERMIPTTTFCLSFHRKVSSNHWVRKRELFQEQRKIVCISIFLGKFGCCQKFSRFFTLPLLSRRKAGFSPSAANLRSSGLISDSHCTQRERLCHWILPELARLLESSTFMLQGVCKVFCPPCIFSPRQWIKSWQRHLGWERGKKNTNPCSTTFLTFSSDCTTSLQFCSKVASATCKKKLAALERDRKLLPRRVGPVKSSVDCSSKLKYEFWLFIEGFSSAQHSCRGTSRAQTLANLLGSCSCWCSAAPWWSRGDTRWFRPPQTSTG